MQKIWHQAPICRHERNSLKKKSLPIAFIYFYLYFLLFFENVTFPCIGNNLFLIRWLLFAFVFEIKIWNSLHMYFVLLCNFVDTAVCEQKSFLTSIKVISSSYVVGSSSYYLLVTSFWSSGKWTEKEEIWKKSKRLWGIK